MYDIFGERTLIFFPEKPKLSKDYLLHVFASASTGFGSKSLSLVVCVGCNL